MQAAIAQPARLEPLDRARSNEGFVRTGHTGLGAVMARDAGQSARQVAAAC